MKTTSKPWTLPPRRVVIWWTLSALPMAMVVAVGGYLSFHYHQLLKQSRDRVDHAYEVLDTLNLLVSAIEDAEAGQRGFIITGDEAYLRPYADAVRNAPLQGQRLRDLLGAGARQKTDGTPLESLAQAKLAELSRGIEIRRQAGFEAARAEVARGEGKALMDALRAGVATMGTAERGFLARSAAEAQHKERETLLIGALVALLSIATRIGIALFLVRLRDPTPPQRSSTDPRRA